jgi:enoyl-CoA hydratase/carnithine racemase
MTASADDVAGRAVLYDVQDGVGWIRLNRPEVGNALNPALVDELDAILIGAEDDAQVRVLVLTGAGADFCNGADLSSLGPLDSYALRMKFGRRMERTGQLFRRLERHPKPVIAAVNGVARAGGLELLLCCDLVVAARGALIGEGHSSHGQLPGGGGSIRLPRKIGPSRAKLLLFTGELFPAETLERWGLVSLVVDDHELDKEAGALAAKLAQKSPLSLTHMKQLVNDGLEQPQDTALRLEIMAAELHLGSGDMAEGMRAIEEGRPPAFDGT